MRVGSLFSGIGGIDRGLERAGMEVVWQVEIDPFCNRVLAKHWPDVWRATDVRAVSRESFSKRSREFSGSRSPSRRQPQLPVRPDLICGGFPCQDVSVAGRRAGLDGARSGLWFEFHRILSELRPRWALIENVPGLLSSNQGRDFAVILDGLEECGFGGIAWAVLDSRHFGVAQRRRRVFIVAGPTRRRAEQVLALCESCGGHSQAGRAAGEDVARPLGASATSFGGQRYDLDNETYVTAEVMDALAVRTAQTGANGWGVNEDGIAYTLDGAQQAVAYAIQERADAERDDVGPQGKGWQEEQAFTLEGRPKVQSVAHTLRAEGFDASEDGTGRGTPLVAAPLTRGSSIGSNEPGRRREDDENLVVSETLNGNPRNRSNSIGPVTFEQASVRRLTPTEAERLQGFPDGWTCLCDERPCRCPDGPRYRALGNAVTVPVAEWIGRRIMAVEGR